MDTRRGNVIVERLGVQPVSHMSWAHAPATVHSVQVGTQDTNTMILQASSNQCGFVFLALIIGIAIGGMLGQGGFLAWPLNCNVCFQNDVTLNASPPPPLRPRGLDHR